jgi:low affinity Fe/Cu permease
VAAVYIGKITVLVLYILGVFVWSLVGKGKEEKKNFSHDFLCNFSSILRFLMLFLS